MKAEIKESTRRIIFVWGCLSLILGLYVLFWLYPMAISWIRSFSFWNPLRPVRMVGLRNYKNLLEDSIFLISLKNTLFLAIYTVPTSIIISLSVAVGLTVLTRRIRSIFTTIYYLPVITSAVAVAAVWQWIFHPSYGLLNYALGVVGLPYQKWLLSPHTALPSVALVAVWQVIGFNALIFLAALLGIPDSLYEAAQIDGANRWGLFRYITLPLLNPALVFVSIIQTIFSFKIFELVYIMPPTTSAGGGVEGGGPGNATRTIVLNIYHNGLKEFRMGYASAQAVILFLIIMLLTFLAWKGRAKWEY